MRDPVTAKRVEANEDAARIRKQDRSRREALHAENRTLWICHHEKMQALHTSLAAEHADRARALNETCREGVV
jgi:hypothetical protein